MPKMLHDFFYKLSPKSVSCNTKKHQHSKGHEAVAQCYTLP